MDKKEEEILNHWRETQHLGSLRRFGTEKDCKAHCPGLPDSIRKTLSGYTGHASLAGISQAFRESPLNLDPETLKRLILQVMAKTVRLEPLQNYLNISLKEREDARDEDVVFGSWDSYLGKYIQDPTSMKRLYSVLTTPFYDYFIKNDTENFKTKLALFYPFSVVFLKEFLALLLKTGRHRALAFVRFLAQDPVLVSKIAPAIAELMEQRAISGQGIDLFLRSIFFHFVLHPDQNYDGKLYVPDRKEIINIIRETNEYDENDAVFLRILIMSPEYSLRDLKSIGAHLQHSLFVGETFKDFFFLRRYWPRAGLHSRMNALWEPYVKLLIREKQKTQNEYPIWTPMLIHYLKFMQKAYPETWGKLEAVDDDYLLSDMTAIE